MDNLCGQPSCLCKMFAGQSIYNSAGFFPPGGAMLWGSHHPSAQSKVEKPNFKSCRGLGVPHQKICGKLWGLSPAIITSIKNTAIKSLIVVFIVVCHLAINRLILLFFDLSYLRKKETLLFMLRPKNSECSNCERVPRWSKYSKFLHPKKSPTDRCDVTWYTQGNWQGGGLDHWPLQLPQAPTWTHGLK